MLKGANPNDVIQNVKERIESVQTSLPEGLRIEPFWIEVILLHEQQVRFPKI